MGIFVGISYPKIANNMASIVVIMTKLSTTQGRTVAGRVPHTHTLCLGSLAGIILFVREGRGREESRV